MKTREILINGMNNYIESIVNIYFGLCEIDDGIKYFHKNYYERDKEVKEYILLRMLDEFEFYDEWIKEYEKYLEKIEYIVSKINENKVVPLENAYSITLEESAYDDVAFFEMVKILNRQQAEIIILIYYSYTVC